MGYDIWIINDEGNRDCGSAYGPHLGDLTYNYTANKECHKYWAPKRDFDGKTVGEAIANLELATSQMIADGFPVLFLSESDILQSMLKRMFLIYADLIKLPRNYRIELES
jgi:hypothetical protein